MFLGAFELSCGTYRQFFPSAICLQQEEPFACGKQFFVNQEQLRMPDNSHIRPSWKPIL